MTGLWLFSLPVLDAVAWQATLLDKSLVFFALVTLNVSLFFLNRLQSSTDRRLVFTLAANVAIFLPMAVAYNSKETSWVILPSLLLLSFVVLGSLDWRGWLRLSRVFVLPTSYAIYRMLTFFINGQGSSSNSLDFGGSPIHDFAVYIDYSANRLTSSPAVVILSAVLLLLTVITLGARPKAKSEARRVLIWAILSTGGTVFLSIFTLYPAAFLMIMPGVFFYVWVLAAGKGFIESLPLKQLEKRISAVSLATLGVLLLIPGLMASYPVYRNVLTQSNNFINALPLIRRYVPQRPHARIYLVLNSSAYGAYKFVGTTSDRSVAQFIFRTTRVNPIFDGDLNNLENTQYLYVWREHPFAYYVVFDAEMRVIGIRQGEQVLYGDPGPA